MRKYILLILCVSLCVLAQNTGKRVVSIDEFFNATAIRSVNISPDGSAVVICTERADWKHDRYRTDLWLWRNNSLTLLTQSGHDSDPKWSPDGQWIAFLSDRAALPVDEDEENVPKEVVTQPTPISHGRDSDADEEKKPVEHLYLIPVSGGEAFPVTRGLEEVHAFDWAPDSKSLYFATRTPWSKEKREAYKKEWKDTIRYREAERGDVIARISVSEAVKAAVEIGTPDQKETAKKKTAEETAETPGAVVVAHTSWRVKQIAVSRDGATVAFNTDSISQRVEGVDAYEIYLVPASGGEPKAITHNQAIETDLRWMDSNTIAFRVGMGSVEGKYADWQGRVYTVDVNSGTTQRWGASFTGSLERYEKHSTGLVGAGMLGTETQFYALQNDAVKFAGWPGSYGRLSAAENSQRVAFVYSATTRPTEVYVADSLDKLKEAKPITSFNKLFMERELPQGKPYRWKAPDGTTVEGMLIYPAGKFEAKHLRTLVLIHGGPADADGDKFGADWYDWAALAAANNWLVFRPNYRGSSGYGDKFMQGIVPNIVSVPGRDILSGVDALVKDGIADPDRLAIGGYSYGGYMTNWLITQTTRFKAAVTGAGAVEHAANWGNDDLTFDDAYYLSGTPWEAPKRYEDEAALFIFNRVKTPTHVVGGADDVRVSVLENYALERSLRTLNIPSRLLIFPGEGHSMSKNPWHGKIKVREELKWLEKYVPNDK
jgi:dipeptidyl aminopeptidase/acylaminoacyl peptidase